MKRVLLFAVAFAGIFALSCLGSESHKGGQTDFISGRGESGHEEGQRGDQGHNENDCDHQDRDHHDRGRQLPASPRQLKALASSPFQINLSWSDQSNNEEGFKIERSTDGKKFEQIAQVLPGTTSYRNTSLFPGTKYFYRVRAYNSSGRSDFSDEVQARTLSPSCPLSVADWGNPYPYMGSTLTGVVATAVGNTFSLVLKSDGTVAGFFTGYAGGASVPDNLNQVVAIDAGNYHSLALRKDGRVVGWGDNYYGQATPPVNLAGVAAIAAGAEHSLALKNDGTVVGWGNNAYGNTTPPANLRGVVAIAAGGAHSLALKSDGTVVGWGGDYIGQATPPPNLTEVVAIAAGGNFSLALKRDGTVVAWGANFLGAALPPTGLSNVVAIAAGDTHSLALQSDGTVVGWGNNGAATLPSSLGNEVMAIAAGGEHSLALTTTPNAPASLVPQVLTANRVSLSWVNQAAGRVGFQIERATVIGQNYEIGEWKQIGSVNSGTTHFDDRSVTTNTSYWYRVRAFNSCSTSAESYWALVKVAPPAEKPYLSVNAFADGVTLYWSAYGSGVTGVRLERALDAEGIPGTWSQILATNASEIYNTSLKDAGLAANTTYWYRVRVVNGLGISPYSDPVSINILPPGAPSYLFPYIGGSNQIVLSWYSAYPYDQQGFKLERSTTVGGVAGTWTQIAILANNTYNGDYVDSGVTAQATYAYRVRAYNVLGDSPYSAEASITVAAPTPPTMVSALSFADTINLRWDQHDYVGSVERYKLERATDVGGSPGTWTEITTVTNSNIYTHDFNYIDKGLTANTTYWYRLRAFNWVGESPYSALINATIVLPDKPYYLFAEIGLTNLVNLSWYSGAMNDQDGFRIERAPDTGTGPGNWTEIGIIGSTNAINGFFSDAGTSANHTYWYRVRAFNMLGLSPYSDPVSLNVVAPAAPDVSATPFANRVQLIWHAQSGGIVGFKLERALDVAGSPGGWTQIARFNPQKNPYGNAYGSFTDTDRAANATYWYRVIAFNWIGDSPYSQAVSVTIVPPAPPASLTAKIGTTNRANLSWVGHGQDEGFKIERAPDEGGNPGAWSPLATVSATNFNYGYFDYADNTVLRGSNYWYRVRSFNIVGDSLYSDATSVSIVPPPAPTGLQATTFADRVDLYWNADFYNYGQVDSIEVERALDTGGTPGTWTRIATVSYYVSSYPDPERLANTKYWYRVRAVNWVGGSPYSQSISVTVPPPATPLGLLAAIGTTNRINLELFASYERDQNGFRLERASDVGGSPGTWEEIADIPATNTYSAACTDTNVTAYTTNWYRIRTYNLAGVSDYADPISIGVVPPPAPSSFFGNAFGDRVNLSWNEYYPGEINGFKVERAPDVSGAPGDWTDIWQASATNSYSGFWYSAYTDPGRIANTTSWYRVRAYNWVGDSTSSIPVSVTTKLPSAPYALSANLGSTNQVDVRWSPNYPYDQDGYLLERATDVGGQPGIWAQIAIITNSYGSYLDTNVFAYTTNWYRVRAFNGVGVSAPSELISIGVIPPLAPVYLVAMAIANQIHLNWWQPYSAEAIGFKIERALDAGGAPGAWLQIATFPSEGNYYASYIDSNLTANTTYWYRMRANNWIGNGPYTTPVQATILLPAAPLFLTATVGNTNQTNLRWYSGYRDEDGFIIEHAEDVGGIPGTWTERATLASSHTDWIYYTDTNVSALTTNWYRVRAFNVVGISTSSVPANVITLPPPPPPNFAASTFAQTVKLSWLGYYPDYGFVEGLKIERAPDADGLPGNWNQIAVVTNASPYSFYTDTNVIAQAAYWYRMRAYNWIGDGQYSLVIGVTINPPGRPSAVTATVGSTNRVNLTVYAAHPNDQDGFRIERASDLNGSPDTWVELAPLPATNYYSADYTDTNVLANTTNWYRVSAFNIIGTSDYTVPVRVDIVPPAAPVYLSATPFTDRINLAWSASAYSDALAGFKLERATDIGGNPGVWVQIATIAPYYYASHTDTLVTTNTTYWYRVRSFSWVGDSLPSISTKATVPSPTSPSPLTSIATNPFVPQILSLMITNHDVVITWTTIGGSTNIIEATTNLAEPFSALSPGLVIPGTNETSTSYRDIAVMTNTPARFYRIRLAP